MCGVCTVQRIADWIGLHKSITDDSLRLAAVGYKVSHPCFLQKRIGLNWSTIDTSSVDTIGAFHHQHWESHTFVMPCIALQAVHEEGCWVLAVSLHHILALGFGTGSVTDTPQATKGCFTDHCSEVWLRWRCTFQLGAVHSFFSKWLWHTCTYIYEYTVCTFRL